MFTKNKNRRKIIMNTKLALATIVISAMLVTPALAENWWDNLHSIVSPPTAPTTGASMCTEYAIQNIRCSGHIKVYDQCTPTMSGNYWFQRTENCELHGEGWGCISGECSYTGGLNNFDVMAFLTQYWWLILIIGGFILWKKKKL